MTREVQNDPAKLGDAPEPLVAETKPKKRADEQLDASIEDTFPASDPPSMTQPGGSITFKPPGTKPAT
jgi:hypothetical protein